MEVVNLKVQVISMDEVTKTMRRMKGGKEVGPDSPEWKQGGAQERWQWHGQVAQQNLERQEDA